MTVRTLTIDGKPTSAREGETILDAARGAGFAIPTHCHLDGLSEGAACRVCLVEMGEEGHLVPACATRVAEAMVVRTDTDLVRESRRTVVELLFAERNHVCAVCVANGHCELQDAAVAVGLDHVRFDYQDAPWRVDLSHDRYGIDHNRCILCTRCVRVCDEIEGAHTWHIAGRGVLAHVVTDMAEPWGESPTCTSCGKCVMACPTGALFLQGSPVSEMEHDRSKLSFLVTAREKKQWLV
jgi:bidirectional [NiFe] hydrogenase diaphorase subunit